MSKTVIITIDSPRSFVLVCHRKINIVDFIELRCPFFRMGEKGIQ